MGKALIEGKSTANIEEKNQKIFKASRQWWIGILLTIISLILILQGVNFTEVRNALGQVNLTFLLVGVGFALSNLVIKARRWQVLYKMRKRISLQRAFSILLIGLMVNAFAPARLGELARAYLLGEIEEESKSYALGTIFIEKLSDLVAFSLAVILLFFQMTLPIWLLESSESIFMLASIALVLVVVAVWFRHRLFNWFKRIILYIAPKRGQWFVSNAYLALTSLQILQSPQLVISLIFWTILLWVTSVLSFYPILVAFGLDLTVWAALFLYVVLQAGVAVPSTPSRIGVFHYLTILSLSVYGVEKELAFSIGVLLHLMVYVPIGFLGFYYLWHENLAWRTLTKALSRMAVSQKQA